MNHLHLVRCNATRKSFRNRWITSINCSEGYWISHRTKCTWIDCSFPNLFASFVFFLQHRLQLEEQLRQQLDNQRRIEEMHALESTSSRLLSSSPISPSLEKSNSDEKFNKLLEQYNKLREEHIAVLRRVWFINRFSHRSSPHEFQEGEVKKQLANLHQEHTSFKDTHKVRKILLLISRKLSHKNFPENGRGIQSI